MIMLDAVRRPPVLCGVCEPYVSDVSRVPAHRCAGGAGKGGDGDSGGSSRQQLQNQRTAEQAQAPGSKSFDIRDKYYWCGVCVGG